MGSGPVVISDDGSPPPGLHLRDLAGKYPVQVGLDEPMAELTSLKSHTCAEAFQISRVVITRNGKILLTFYNPSLVLVTGAGRGASGTVNPAEILVPSGGGAASVSSPREKLTDVTSGSPFFVYSSSDMKISKVQLDDVVIDVSGLTCRVELFY